MTSITRHRIKVKPGVIYQTYRDMGISRDEMARRVGVSTATAYRVEMNKVDPSPHFIAGLIALTGKPFETFFDVEAQGVAA